MQTLTTPLSDVSPSVAIAWPIVWALVGLGIGLALDRAATWIHRQYDSTANPNRTIGLALFTAVLFGLAGWRFGLSFRAVLSSLYIGVLVLITVTDLELRIVPNRVILPAILVAAVAGLAVNWMTWRAVLLGGATGLVFFGVAYGLAAVLYPGKIGLGMGDVTLATFIGLAVGFPQAIVALVLGVLFGGLVSSFLLVARRATMHTAIPYGPFLVLGGLVTLLWGEAIVKWYLRM